MIIVCPECSTKFDLNPDRIPAAGAKVRCAKCKHVFLAKKTPEEEASILDVAEGFQAEPPTEKNISETVSEESDFDYNKFQELDSSAKEEETFTFGAKIEAEEDFTFTKSTDESVSPIEKAFPTSEEKIDEAIAETAAVADVVNEAVAETEPPAEPEFPSQPTQAKKGGPVSSIVRILLLLILGIIIIGGVFVYMNGTDQLNQTIQQIFGQKVDQPVQTGQITLSALEGKFIQNGQDGELFLIRGEAINNFSEPRAGIQVKGVIFDQNGKPLLQKTVFCGNPIGDQKLLSLSFLELEKIMGNQFGHELSNMKIDSKQAIPFDIVFKDLPKNLSEFSVKVTASKLATE